MHVQFVVWWGIIFSFGRTMALVSVLFVWLYVYVDNFAFSICSVLCIQCFFFLICLFSSLTVHLLWSTTNASWSCVWYVFIWTICCVSLANSLDLNKQDQYWFQGLDNSKWIYYVRWYDIHCMRHTPCVDN